MVFDILGSCSPRSLSWPSDDAPAKAPSGALDPRSTNERSLKCRMLNAAGHTQARVTGSHRKAGSCRRSWPICSCTTRFIYGRRGIGPASGSPGTPMTPRSDLRSRRSGAICGRPHPGAVSRPAILNGIGQAHGPRVGCKDINRTEANPDTQFTLSRLHVPFLQGELDKYDRVYVELLTGGQAANAVSQRRCRGDSGVRGLN